MNFHNSISTDSLSSVFYKKPLFYPDQRKGSEMKTIDKNPFFSYNYANESCLYYYWKDRARGARGGNVLYVRRAAGICRIRVA
jgi:hypothetical protein